MDLRELVILHSNDMHGDFFDKEQNAMMVGGISRLSGYIQKVRRGTTPSIYLIAGDMLQGSIVDQEYKGISTIDIVNVLSPDIVTLGNHELDYGLGHLMFLEKCAKFPIINANLYIKPTGTRLFRGYQILEVDGIRILFIGIITEEVMEFGKQDPLLGSFVDINEAANAVSYYCNNFKDIDIDLTVLITHIGFEADKQLAALLPRELGVDLIIGGHSHTMLDEPYRVNDILITQVGTGTTHIGRYDLTIDMDTNSIHSFKWQAVPINEHTCPIDTEMHAILSTYRDRVDDKYGRIIRRLPRKLTHPSRFQETELGNFFADIFAERLDLDIALIGSGSIRTPYLDSVVTLRSIREAFPYDDVYYSFFVTGEQLREMFDYHMQLHHGQKGCREFYQVSSKFRYEIDESGSIVKFLFEGKPVDPQRRYRIGIQGFHLAMTDTVFGVAKEKLEQEGKIRTESTSCFDIVDEALEHTPPTPTGIEGRIILARSLVDH